MEASGADMHGRICVVTGGTQGVGESIARLFAARGAAGIVIAGREQQRGNAVAEELTRSGCRTLFVGGDLADVELCRQVIRETDRQFGRVDTLVNCAATTERGTIFDTSVEQFDRIFAINIRAPFFLIQEAAILMRREQTQGTIVNIISMESHGGHSFITAYCATKGALATLTRNVANALLPFRIRVNALNIGWTDTPAEHLVQQSAHGAGPQWLEEAEKQQPFGRLLKPMDVARATAFLASPESGVMTGSVVDFDQTIHGAYAGSPKFG